MFIFALTLFIDYTWFVHNIINTIYVVVYSKRYIEHRKDMLDVVKGTRIAATQAISDFVL